MTTATATEPRKRNLVEVLPPEMYKFEKTHEQVSGYLLAVNTIEVKGKKVNEYLIGLETSDRKKVTFLGTWDLDKKFETYGIGRAHGCFVEITYLGEDQEVKTQGNALKRFRVRIDDGDRLKRPNNPEITDDDLPPGW